MLAIIGGSYFQELVNLNVKRKEVVRTPYGEPSGVLYFGTIGNQEIVFLNRHGFNHRIPAHLINNCANIHALSQFNVEGIISIGAVSSVRKTIPIGSLVVPNQIIDYTYSRRTSFDDKDATRHIDFAEPYDEALRKKIIKADPSVVYARVYGCIQGPRLETKAEALRMQQDGVDIIGMTAMPEAVIAREAGIPYVGLNWVKRWGGNLYDVNETQTETLSSDELLEKSLTKTKFCLDQLFQS
jgi:purine nucleoside phosphorylase